MCGIFGFSRLTENTRKLIPVLAVYMEDRGEQSWGVTDGFDLFKTVGAITKTYNNEFIGWDAGEGIIFHTRAASAGSSVTTDNAHPHRFNKDMGIIDGKQVLRTVTGIHNGYISNHHALKNKYKDRENFGVDSKHIFKNIIDAESTDQLDGSGVIAWFDTYHEALPNNEIVFMRNNLYLARFKSASLAVVRINTGEIVFASTMDSIKAAVALADLSIDVEYSTREMVRYNISVEESGKDLVYVDGDMSFGKEAIHFPPAKSPHIQPGYVHNSGHYRHGVVVGGNSFKPIVDEDIFKCPCCDTPIEPTQEAMCAPCFSSWISGNVTIVNGATDGAY